MEAVLGFILLYGLFSLNKAEPKPTPPPKPTIIEQAIKACDSSTMKSYRRGSLEFQCITGGKND